MGTPMNGMEWTVSKQCAVNVDSHWMPYMFKRTEEIYRGLQLTADFRYNINPEYYYTNDLFDGFYLGPYAMYFDFNMGRKKHEEMSENRRYTGWGISGGVSVGYKMYLSKRFRLDFNLGLGFAHLQYDTYILGAENTRPIAKKDTRAWIGPTKIGVHLVYNLFR